MMSLTEDIPLFTLPVSKRGYVKEKYVLGLLFLRRDLASFRVRQSGLCVSTGRYQSMCRCFFPYAMPFVLVLILLGVALPVQLKCGNEKGRLAVVAVGLGAFLLIADSVTDQMAPYRRDRCLRKSVRDWCGYTWGYRFGCACCFYGNFVSGQCARDGEKGILEGITRWSGFLTTLFL